MSKQNGTQVEVHEPPKATTAVDSIDYTPEGFVELPHTKLGNGDPVIVQIRAIREDRLIPIMRGIPVGATSDSDGRPRSAAEIFDFITEYGPTAAQIAELGVVAPSFSFEDEPVPGKVCWPALPFVDRNAVVDGILSLSGLGSNTTKVVRSFRDGNARGRRVRG